MQNINPLLSKEITVVIFRHTQWSQARSGLYNFYRKRNVYGMRSLSSYFRYTKIVVGIQ
jgi:hypothetical protein